MLSVVLVGSVLPDFNLRNGRSIVRCSAELTAVALWLKQPSTVVVVRSDFPNGAAGTAFWEAARINNTLVGVVYDPETEDGQQFVLSGASALIPHGCTAAQLEEIFQTLEADLLAVPIPIMSRALRHCLAHRTAVLTSREQEVFSLACSGLSNQAIAERLLITRETVRWYMRSIHSKLGSIQLRKSQPSRNQ